MKRQPDVMMTATRGIRIGLALLAALFLYAASPADASTTYKVRKGDNPSRIARKFNISLKDLQQANQIDPDNMRPGDRIIIPGSNKPAQAKETKKKAAGEARKKENPASAKSPRPAVKEQEKTAAPNSGNNRYHTVAKGDTLSSLARKYATTADAIQELNSLKSAKLKKGQKLLVKRSGPRMYTVRKGDNIWKIARKFDMDPDDLMEINQLESPALALGQKLCLDQIIDPEQMETAEQATRNIEEEIKTVAASEEFRETRVKDKVVLFAKKLLDIPYKFGGNTIFGIDCSAYVKKVYGFLGVDLPRTAREQFHTGEEIAKEELSVGDLVFFRTYASFPSHVGIYLGNNLFIHASSKGKKVTIDSLETPYYLKRFIGAKRLVNEEPLTEEQHQDTGKSGFKATSSS